MLEWFFTFCLPVPHLYFPCSTLNQFSKKPWFLVVEFFFKKKIWVLNSYWNSSSCQWTHLILQGSFSPFLFYICLISPTEKKPLPNTINMLLNLLSLKIHAGIFRISIFLSLQISKLLCNVFFAIVAVNLSCLSSTSHQGYHHRAVFRRVLIPFLIKQINSSVWLCHQYYSVTFLCYSKWKHIVKRVSPRGAMKGQW